MPQTPFLDKKQQNKYLIQWDKGARTPLIDAVLYYVTKVCPDHDKLGHVLPKVILIDTLYHTRLRDAFAMAEHIIATNAQQSIAPLIASGDSRVVRMLTRCRFDGKDINCYCFATKYCSFHNPNKFPIYDSMVDTFIWKHRKELDLQRLKRNSLKDYDQYRAVIDHCISAFDLQGGYKRVDEYLWQMGGGEIA